MRQFKQPRDSEKLVRVVCYLPAHEAELLRLMAKRRHISVSAALRLLVTELRGSLFRRIDLTSTERRSDEGGD